MRGILVSIFALAFSLFSNAQPDARNVLFLNSYHPGLSWSDDIFNGIKQITDKQNDINLFAEYLDARRFNNPEYFESYLNLLNTKYKGISMDAVICADNSALDFVIKNAANPLFKGFKVFCGVSNVEDYQYLGDDYKGVSEREFFKERFNTFKTVCPDVQTIYFLVDKSYYGLTFRKRLEEIIKRPPYPVTIKIIDEIDVNDICAFVSSNKEQNAVIDYVNINKDRYGNIVNNEKLSEKIAKISSVPVFSNFDFLIGKGIVGGLYQLGSDQGKEAGSICVRLLSGIPPASIPKISEAPMRFILDYNIIKKFGLQLSNLPPEAILINKPEKIYVKYYPEFIIGLTSVIILIGIISFLLISIRKRNLYERRLIQSEQKFKDIAELLPQTVFESDLEGNLTFVNKQAFKMFGYSTGEFKIGINIVQLFLPEESEHLKSNIVNVIEGKPNNDHAFIAIRKDGSTFPFEVHANVFYKDGKPAGIRGIGLDITKQKETEQELINAREKAEQSDKLKSAFLSNMSHEIRTPLNAIIGFSNLLTDVDTADDQRLEYRKYIQNSSDYLLNLVNDIIDHSRIEAGQLEIIDSEFNLNEILKELYLNFKSQQKNKFKDRIQFIYENLDQTEQILVIADPVRIKQVVGNLLDNAFKFTDKGSISFGYTIQQGDHLLITVKDTGRGISEDEKLQVFRRFYKLCSDNDKLYGGSGLGLSICKNLVSLMKGSIWLESKKGEGTTFFVNIPVQIKRYKQVVATKSSSGEDTLQFNWPGKIILIAEDEISNFELIKAYLDHTGSEILHAKNGKEAVDLALNNMVDVILMDIQMPVMTGYDAIKIIRKEKPYIPIIAQTAYAMAGEKEEIIKSGSDAYLSKPLDKYLLLETIHSVISK